MRSLLKRHVWIALASGVLIAGVVGVVAAQSAKTPQKWPPQFPREGATKIFENDQVIVWEQVGRPKTPFVHKHLRDILTFQVEPGRIDVLGPDLQKIVSSSRTGATQQLTPANRGGLSFTKAGLGPHAEVEAETAKPSRSIFVEIKGTEPKDCKEWSTAC